MSKDNRSSWLADLVQDTRRAVRALIRNPAFTLIGIITVALGVGATTAVFSIANALLLRRLPIPDAARVVSINEDRSGNVQNGPEGTRVEFPRFEKYREATRSVFPDLAGHENYTVSISIKGAALSSPASLVTRNYFDVLGIKPSCSTPSTSGPGPCQGGRKQNAS